MNTFDLGGKAFDTDTFLAALTPDVRRVRLGVFSKQLLNNWTKDRDHPYGADKEFSVLGNESIQIDLSHRAPVNQMEFFDKDGTLVSRIFGYATALVDYPEAFPPPPAMDYRMIDVLETDYGTLEVTEKAPAPFGYTRLTLHHEGWDEDFTLGVNEQGQPHPESELALMDDLAHAYERYGPLRLAITPAGV